MASTFKKQLSTLGLTLLVLAPAFALAAEQLPPADQSNQARSQSSPGAQSPPSDQRFAAGKAKAVACMACHGAEGDTTNPMLPDLAGQNAAYLEIQLNNFKTGQRYDPVMSPVAESLSNRDIEDLATYFGSLDPEDD